MPATSTNETITRLQKVLNKSVGKSLDEFHYTFNFPQDVPYTSETEDTKAFRKKLIKEEVAELFEAIDKDNKADILKELVDVVVVCVGMADTYGWEFDEAFRRVHRSNMSKVDENGEPQYREDGKLLKGERYSPPFLRDLVGTFS